MQGCCDCLWIQDAVGGKVPVQWQDAASLKRAKKGAAGEDGVPAGKRVKTEEGAKEVRHFGWPIARAWAGRGMATCLAEPMMSHTRAHAHMYACDGWADAGLLWPAPWTVHTCFQKQSRQMCCQGQACPGMEDRGLSKGGRSGPLVSVTQAGDHPSCTYPPPRGSAWGGHEGRLSPLCAWQHL